MSMKTLSAIGRKTVPCLIDNPGFAVYFHENRLVFILSKPSYGYLR